MVRPSPSESATLFYPGFMKKGNDGNIWIIVTDKNGRKRWQKARFIDEKPKSRKSKRKSKLKSRKSKKKSRKSKKNLEKANQVKTLEKDLKAKENLVNRVKENQQVD